MTIKYYFSETAAKEFGYKQQEIIQENGNVVKINFTHSFETNNVDQYNKLKLAFNDFNLILACQKESIIPNSLKIFSNTNNLSFVKPINKTRQQEIKEQMKGSTPFKKFGLFITVIAENLKLLNKDKNDFKQRLKKMRDYQEKISHNNKIKI